MLDKVEIKNKNYCGTYKILQRARSNEKKWHNLSPRGCARPRNHSKCLNKFESAGQNKEFSCRVAKLQSSIHTSRRNFSGTAPRADKFVKWLSFILHYDFFATIF